MSRRASLVLLGLVGLVWSAQVRAADPPKSKPATIDVIGLQITRVLPEEKEEVASIGFPGTSVDVFVALPGKFIVCSDRDNSKVDSFVDDLGTDLTRPQPGRKTGGFSIQPAVGQVSRDGSRCRLTLRAASVPAKGARTVKIKGSVVVKCGSGEQTVQTADVALPGPEEEVKVGDFTLSGGTRFLGDGIMLDLRSDQPNVKSITLFGPDSKEIKSNFLAAMKFPGSFQGGKYHQTITINRPAGKVTIRVTYFKNVEDVTIPIDLSVGLGL